MAEQLGLDRAPASNQHLCALQQLAVGKALESALHDLTSRDRWGEIANEHTMGFFGFRGGTDSGDRPTRFLKVAFEGKCVQARMSCTRGHEVWTTPARRKVPAKSCQFFRLDFSKKPIGVHRCSVQLALKPVGATNVGASRFGARFELPVCTCVDGS